MVFTSEKTIAESEHFIAVVTLSDGWTLVVKRKNSESGLHFIRSEKNEIVKLLESIPPKIKKMIEDYEGSINKPVVLPLPVPEPLKEMLRRDYVGEQKPVPLKPGRRLPVRKMNMDDFPPDDDDPPAPPEIATRPLVLGGQQYFGKGDEYIKEKEPYRRCLYCGEQCGEGTERHTACWGRYPGSLRCLQCGHELNAHGMKGAEPFCTSCNCTGFTSSCREMYPSADTIKVLMKASSPRKANDHE